MSDLSIPLKCCSSKSQCLHPDGPYLPATLEFFYPRNNRKSGLTSKCRECLMRMSLSYSQTHVEENKKRCARYRHANLAHAKQRDHEYHLSHQVERTEYAKRYRHEHKSELREKALIYRRNHKQEFSQRASRYFKKYKDDPEFRLKAKIRQHIRRARLSGLPSSFSNTDWENCFNYWHGSCAYCGKQAEGLWNTVHQEHFIPVSDVARCPGTVRWNMLPACEHCNLSKGNKEPRQWVINTFGKRKGAQILKHIDEYFESVKL